MSDETIITEADDEPVKRRLWQRVLSAPEGKILLLGLLLAAAYVTALVLVRFKSRNLFRSLLAMTTTHMLGGRLAGMSAGFGAGFQKWLVTLVSMVIESSLVLLLYPLFVFSYDRLIVIKPLEDTMARARRAAEAHQGKIMKYGIPGLFFFVWFPFLMTGPLVGAIIGFLIRLRPWVNMCVVLAGTYIAILCWGAILNRVSEGLQRIGPYAQVAFLGVILLVAVSIHVRYAFANQSDQQDQ